MSDGIQQDTAARLSVQDAREDKTLVQFVRAVVRDAGTWGIGGSPLREVPVAHLTRLLTLANESEAEHERLSREVERLKAERGTLIAQSEQHHAVAMAAHAETLAQLGRLKERIRALAAGGAPKAAV